MVLFLSIRAQGLSRVGTDLVGEVKLSLNRRKLEIAETELEEKVQRLPFKDGYQQVLTKVFCLEAKKLKIKDRKWIAGDEILRVLR